MAVFADTVYWIALARPDNQWHGKAQAAARALGQARIVTTDEVLAEFLTALSRGGPRVRSAAVRIVRQLRSRPDVLVLPQSRESFDAALERYEARQDKSYSLQDCSSMNAMEAEGITDVLTSDLHFEQEGFTVLMRRADTPSP